MSTRLSRAAYADMFGPTTGDRVRLADTALLIEIEKEEVASRRESCEGDQLLLGHHPVQVGLEMTQGILGVVEEEFLTGQSHGDCRQSHHNHNHGDLPEKTAKLATALPLDARRADVELEKMLSRRRASGFAPVACGASGLHARAESERAAILQQRVEKSSPEAAAALGSRLVSVMPGMVLISRTVGPPRPSSTSTRL